MTAVLGILNKQGVAIAADSAVTISGSNGRKIFNTANKIFTLSKYHPIGIMIYNSASLMLTPWETIIKTYRKHLGNQSFETVKQYQENFIAFISDNNFFTTIDIQKHLFREFATNNVVELSNQALQDGTIELTGIEDEDKATVINYLKVQLQNLRNTFILDTTFSNKFETYTQESFNIFTEGIIENVCNSVFPGIDDNELINLIKESFYLYMKSRRYITSSTGIVFVGFGEKEIYPCSVALQVAEAFDNKLRYFIDREEAISDSNNGSIMPFAQRDVIDTIITGINPELDQTYKETYKDFLTKYNQYIAELVEPTNKLLAENIRNLDLNTLVNQFSEQINQLKNDRHIKPTVDTVAILSKEDLAEMAESLIYLTYLKRRMSFAEESVGGPVDVAIISKGDGFIWIKRKHYFKPELNQHFFKNYFLQ